MKRWPTKPLGEIAQVTAGDPAPQRAEDFSEDGIPFVRMQDVGRFGQTTCLIETKDRLSTPASRKFKRFPPGSILVPKSGASIRLNHRAILGTEAHVVSHLAVIIPSSLLNNRFAYYWLCGTDLSGVAHQADLPSMKTSDLAKLPIPVPPLAEQERIVKLLDEADELRKLRAQADRRTAALIPALFHEMFGDPKVNPRGWPIKALGELLLTTEQRDPKEKPSTEFVYLDITGVDNKAKTIIATKRFIGADAPSRARKVIRKGDVIVSTVRPNLNAVALIPDELDDEICSTGFSVLRPSGKVMSDYIFAFVRSPYFIDNLVARTTGANYPAVNDGEVKSVSIPVPPLALQKEFAERVTEIRALETAQATSRTRLDALFQAMLHRAFEGEL